MWTTDQVRAAEDRLLARTPDGALMRRAAFGLAGAVASLLRSLTGGTAGRRVTLLVGAGNNGGDALWAGAFLRRRSVAVTAVLLSPDRAHVAGLVALRKAGGRVSTTLDDPDVVVDGIVGLQARGSLRPAAASLVAQVDVPIVAVDGPAVRAALTVTFGARKPVHVLNTTHCGEVQLVDIGLGPELPDPDLVVLEPDDVGYAWRVPGPTDDKYTQGVTGIAAGSATYPGAAVLSCGAAVLATSGMVRYAGYAADVVRGRWPELVATGTVEDAGRVQAWVVGPGLGTGQTGRHILTAVLDEAVPTCVDADGITLLAATPTLWDARDPDAPMVLTPHDREFARIAEPLGITLGTDRVAAARALSKRLNSVVLLKGNATVVAAPDGRTLVNPARSSWLATAGSGDVLTGLIGALLATGLDPWLAAGCAAWVHVRAGEVAAGLDVGVPISASRILEAIPEAIRTALEHRESRVQT